MQLRAIWENDPRRCAVRRWIFAAILGACASAPPAWATKVDVDVDGLEGELHQNVLHGLTIQQRRKTNLSDPEVRELHVRATEEIQRALEPFGYYRAGVTATLERGRSKWLAHYVVDKGRRMAIDSLVVDVHGPGTADPAIRKLLDDFPIKQGAPLVHWKYEKAKDDLTGTALGHGYIDSHYLRHDLIVDLDRYTAAAILEFETGELHRFGPTTFHQDFLHTDLVKGYVDWREGDPFDYRRLLAIEQNLGNTTYFSHVEVRPRRDLEVDARVPVEVTLEPARREKYTFGGGYGTDTGPNASAGIELRRINRRGHRGDVEGRVSQVERSGAARYQVPWPYPRSDVLTLSTGFTRRAVSSIREHSDVAGAAWTRLWAGWHQAIALNYRRERFEIGLDQGTSNLIVPEMSWSRIRTDVPNDPKDGRRLRYRFSGSSTTLGSDASYARLEFGGKWLRSVAPLDRVLARVDLGYEWTSQFHELPPSARFFAGGTESVRGYGYEELGARDAAGNVIGGTTLATGSLEFEHRILPQWGIAAFYDLGNAMMNFSEPLEHGAGLGIRWVSPVGLVRLDAAMPLRHAIGPRFHIAMGAGL